MGGVALAISCNLNPGYRENCRQVSQVGPVTDCRSTGSARRQPPTSGSIKLASEDAYRVRVGDYRIIYTIHDNYLLILVIDIGHRGEVYRRR